MRVCVRVLCRHAESVGLIPAHWKVLRSERGAPCAAGTADLKVAAQQVACKTKPKKRHTEICHVVPKQTRGSFKKDREK